MYPSKLNFIEVDWRLVLVIREYDKNGWRGFVSIASEQNHLICDEEYKKENFGTFGKYSMFIKEFPIACNFVRQMLDKYNLLTGKVLLDSDKCFTHKGYHVVILYDYFDRLTDKIKKELLGLKSSNVIFEGWILEIDSYHRYKKNNVKIPADKKRSVLFN